MEEEWKEFAKIIHDKSGTGVIIAEMESNLIPDEFGIDRFPRIKLFPAKDKDHPLTFQLPRTLKFFEEFLIENSPNYQSYIESE